MTIAKKDLKSNGKGTKLVKAQDKGNVKKNPTDTAGEKIHNRINTLAKGSKKTPKFKKD